MFELIFTLEKHYRPARTAIRDGVLAIVKLPAVVLPDKESYDSLFEIYVAHPGLSYADCYHIFLMRHLQLTEIMSFDHGFDRFPDIVHP